VAQCPGKNDRWDEGPILGCTNGIGDPKIADRKTMNAGFTYCRQCLATSAGNRNLQMLWCV
jgi:hypothetical protein